LLGEVAVPVGLAVGSPQNVSLAWTVPTGTPNHSCIFGVVRSDAEAEGDQSALDWWQFETLSYNDNDWAQRNLDIENVSSSNSGDSNSYESAPFFIELPPMNQRPSSSLTLEIDARQARGLETLSFEVVNGKTTSLQPGRVQAIRIDIRDVRERLVVVFHVEVPARLKVGTRMTIGVNPSIGKREFVGWATEFRVAPPRDVLAQTLDEAAAAFGDLAELADVPGVHALFCAIGKGRCGRPYSSAAMADRLATMRRELERAGSELDRLAAARATGAGDAMERLLDALDGRGPSRKTSVETVIAAYRAVCSRTMMAAALMARTG
jgi:hypothetical protein